jgi:hypothetical protein
MELQEICFSKSFEFATALTKNCGLKQTMHCTENSKQIFPEMKLRGLVPNICIHVSVSDLYIQHNRSAQFAVLRLRTTRCNIYNPLTYT